MDRSVTSTLTSLTKKFAAFAATSAAVLGAVTVGVGIQIARTVTQFDSLERGLTAVMGSASAAKAELAKLREVAKLPGLGIAEAIQGSINLQAAGMSADEARKALMAFGNALATVGKGKADLDGVNLALTQIMSKGKVSAEEINQLNERVPQIRQAMKSAFGTADTEVLQKMGIDAKTFVNGIVAELGKLPPVTGGLQNAWENAMDNMTMAMISLKGFVGPIVETLSSDLAQFFGNIQTWAENNGSKLTEWATKLRNGFDKVVEGTSLFLSGLLNLQGPTDTLNQAMDKLIDSFNNMGQWWATNGFRMGESIRNAWADIGAYIVIAAAALIAFKAAIVGNWMVALIATAAALGTYLGLRIARRNRVPGTPPPYTPLTPGESGSTPTVSVTDVTPPKFGKDGLPIPKPGETVADAIKGAAEQSLKYADMHKKLAQKRADEIRDRIRLIHDEIKAEKDRMLQQVGFRSVRSIWSRGMEAGQRERFSTFGTSLDRGRELTVLEKQQATQERIVKGIESLETVLKVLSGRAYQQGNATFAP